MKKCDNDTGIDPNRFTGENFQNTMIYHAINNGLALNSSFILG